MIKPGATIPGFFVLLLITDAFQFNWGKRKFGNYFK